MTEERTHLTRRRAILGTGAVVGGGAAVAAYSRYVDRPELSVAFSQWTGGRFEMIEDEEGLQDVVLRENAEFVLEASNVSQRIQDVDVSIGVRTDFTDHFEEITDGTVVLTVRDGIEIFNLDEDLDGEVSLTQHSGIAIEDFEPPQGEVKQSEITLRIAAEIASGEPDEGAGGESVYDVSVTVDSTGPG